MLIYFKRVWEGLLEREREGGEGGGGNGEGPYYNLEKRDVILLLDVDKRL